MLHQLLDLEVIFFFFLLLGKTTLIALLTWSLNTKKNFHVIWSASLPSLKYCNILNDTFRAECSWSFKLQSSSIIFHTSSKSLITSENKKWSTFCHRGSTERWKEIAAYQPQRGCEWITWRERPAPSGSFWWETDTCLTRCLPWWTRSPTHCRTL